MNVKLEIRHLRLLAAVAEEGSVTAAAKSLHVTQSALSHQLRDAEERLNTRLFLRSGKRMLLTPAGDYLLTAARRLLQDLSRAEDHLHDMQEGNEGVIRLSTECNTSYHWLPVLWANFQRKFPNVKVVIDVDSTRDPITALVNGKLDVALVTCPPGNRNLVFTPVGESEVVIALPLEHRLAALPYIAPQDLEDETLLVFPPRENSTLLNEYLKPAGICPKEVISVPLTEVMIEMVASGMGVAWLSRFAVAPQLAAGKVVARSFTKDGLRKTWYAATLKEQLHSPHLCEFVGMLGEATAGLEQACLARHVQQSAS